MNGNDPPKYLYLNRDNRWLDFGWAGLELGLDGTLSLATLPRPETPVPQDLVALPTPAGPAGIAIGHDGSIYFSDPVAHRLRRLDACDGSVAPVDCVTGAGGLPTQLREPRGLSLHPIRHVLLVADSGNHRIQLFDPVSWQLVDIWGQPFAVSEPQPSGDLGRFNQPWSLASDAAGNVYVVDHGNGRVQKFDLLGNVMPTFAEALRDHGVTEPTAVAVNTAGPSTEIYVLDASARTVFVVDADGALLRSFVLHIEAQQPLDQPMGLAVTPDALYVGDNLRRRVLKFTPDGALVGAALGYEAPVAALAMSADVGLLVHPGGEVTPLRLALKGGYVRRGVLWGGPFDNPSARRDQWHRLKAMIAPLPADAHLQLYIYSTTNDASPPIPSSPASSFAVPPWRQLLNRLVSGYGVVCGLDVEPGPEPNQIVVTPGVAIDKRGYEIIVPKRTTPIAIPADLMASAASSYAQQRAEQETGVHALICYHECESDPAPVLAGDCHSTQVCAPSTIREQYQIVFKAGSAPPIVLECRLPDVISGKRLDCPALARWVSSACPELPEDPCIPLANIRIEGEEGHRCNPDNIDITIRPIVYANDILFDLLLSLLTEPSEQRRGK